MPRIVFLCPFTPNDITGGTKTVYRHAELLTESGFDAFVHQPEGRPRWFESTAKLLRDRRFAPVAGDVLVFPEVLNGELAELAQASLPAKKILYCQAHIYTLFNSIAPERLSKLGFARVACQSTVAKGFLERVLRLNDVAIIPCFIDTELFHPREKLTQIAFIPRKLPREAAAIEKIFRLKHRDLQWTRWVPVENRSEREIAEIFGRSAVVLSLPFLESFGLVPLEAMASGALVAGFHGYGGQEYADDENGIWLPPDHLEETADALARLIGGLMQDDQKLTRMRDAGFATVSRYSKQATHTALVDFYSALMQ